MRAALVCLHLRLNPRHHNRGITMPQLGRIHPAKHLAFRKTLIQAAGLRADSRVMDGVFSALAFPEDVSTSGMPNRSSMQDSSAEATTFLQVVAHGSEQSTSDIQQALSSIELRKQVMQEMGRLGGLKGGVARARKLSPEQRQEIARRAATSRWEKNT